MMPLQMDNGKTLSYWPASVDKEALMKRLSLWICINDQHQHLSDSNSYITRYFYYLISYINLWLLVTSALAPWHFVEHLLSVYVDYWLCVRPVWALTSGVKVLCRKVTVENHVVIRR